MKKLVIGILAHVDAGKTTLSEELLYLCGEIRKIGRVDHGDAFLDTYELEKERGITIFSKQALLKTENMEVTILDTPGHVDFSAEMERTLQVLDYAILVINGMDGVQSHTMTLWRLLERYQIPTFLFVNKMDQQGTDHDALLNDLKQHLHENCVDFGRTQDTDYGMYELTPEQLENIAVCEEDILETYLETGIVEDRDIARLIIQRKIFPCYFGSALKEKGVKDFWNGVQKYTAEPKRPTEFGAKVFKIARDEQGNRLTYMKITGGSLKVKTLLSSNSNGQSLPGRKAEEDAWEEKADQIRLYSGAKYELTSEAEAGTVCAVTGLTRTYPGEGLGIEQESELPILEPVLNYQIILPDDCDPHQMLQKLDIHQPERTVDLPCDSHITAGRQCDAARMVVSQHHARRPAFECFGDHFRHGNRRGVGAALGDEHATQQHAAVIHSRHIKSFLRAGEEFRHEKCAGFFYACKRHFVGRLVLQIICAHLRDKFEHDGAGMPHAGHTLQFFDGRVQHS
ncbi:MAG: GTP-binding protein, partial [Blautia obeum]|nr:GTP-binding protein [Blautia obeum]